MHCTESSEVLYREVRAPTPGTKYLQYSKYEDSGGNGAAVVVVVVMGQCRAGWNEMRV